MSDQKPLRVTVVGASDAGSAIALKAQAAGHRVTLVDEHPQTMGQMSFDAPWFYGAALPAALMNANAVAQVVLEANPGIFACSEAGVDVRVGTIAWGAFQNGQNSRHIGVPKVGLVSAEGNELLEHDVLILAPGVRDFVPAFRGAELPGVFGVKAGVAFLDLYQCYEGKRTLVLGTTSRAVDFVRRAIARGVEIVGMVEPGTAFTAGDAARDEIAALGIPVHYSSALLAAEGKGAVTAARICYLSGVAEMVVDCDSLCLAIGVLPNIELPAAMGCRMRFDAGVGSWLPETDVAGRTSVENVFWLSGFASGGADPDTILAAMAEGGAMGDVLPAPTATSDQGTYLRSWIEALHASGGGAVILCKCESVTREDFLGLAPPAYLHGGLRHPQSPVTGPEGTGPRVHQDLMKRMTRVGMGHCQGKRCRDEAALILSLRFGIGQEAIRPGSYRFPVRPVDLSLIASAEPAGLRWSYWLHDPEPVLE